MRRGKQIKEIDIERGLLLVRYADADDERWPPKVRVAVDAKRRRDIDLVLSPNEDEPILSQPGACLVVRASAPGQLAIEVIPSKAGGSTAARVQIETLTQGREPAKQPSHEAAESRSDRLSVLGHVAGLGDVVVREGEWIAGPGAPARIEGLAIDWPGKPDDVELSYSVRLARPHAASGRLAQPGDYAGTRGRALPIVGVAIELTGPGARNFTLSGEAAFLGAPLMRVSGRQVAVAGPTGREPLVGFKLRLEEASPPLQREVPRVNRAKSSNRVRVFRPSSEMSRTRASKEAFLDSRDERQPA